MGKFAGLLQYNINSLETIIGCKYKIETLYQTNAINLALFKIK